MQTTLEGFETFERLKNDAYLLVDHGISEEEIEDGMTAYANFSENLPDPSLEVINQMMPGIDEYTIGSKQLDDYDYSKDTQKFWHKYRTSFPEWEKPGGYSNRSLQTRALIHAGRKILDEKTSTLITPTEDPKEFYQFHPNTISLEAMRKMHEEFEWGHIPTEVTVLHGKLAVIHAKAREATTPEDHEYLDAEQIAINAARKELGVGEFQEPIKLKESGGVITSGDEGDEDDGEQGGPYKGGRRS